MLSARVIERTKQIIPRNIEAVSAIAEWFVPNLLQRGRPWSKNRFGQRYQAMCFADHKHLRNGNPEIGESLWMERNLPEGGVVLDVGANHGIVSLECALFVGPSGIVHAFEPAPTTRACLIRHLKINNIQNVSVFGVAAGERVGHARLRVYGEATGAATLSESDPDHVADEVIEIETTTLDEHCKSLGIGLVNLLKIDVEGHEIFALRGAKNMLAAKKVKAIMFEVGDRTCKNANVDPQELLAELESSGYGVFSIKANGDAGQRLRRFPATPDGQNFLALPD